jgi:hypothetical protein
MVKLLENNSVYNYLDAVFSDLEEAVSDIIVEKDVDWEDVDDIESTIDWIVTEDEDIYDAITGWPTGGYCSKDIASKNLIGNETLLEEAEESAGEDFMHLGDVGKDSLIRVYLLPQAIHILAQTWVGGI